MLLREELDEAIEGEFACFAVEVELVFEAGAVTLLRSSSCACR
jgi:hypothetical protein